ncbi:class F sortase [Nocardioides sp.]|uniref:class F sortase n=1 Tax=Nocardioides sp. TaxID=35761 RepID=UPI00286AD263|nr:class F sortase [Nocardioides sp.]
MTPAEQAEATDARIIRGLLLVALVLVFLGPALPSSEGSGTGSLEASPAVTLPAGDDAILVPSISLDAPLVPIAKVGEVLTPPSDTDQVGWWDLSAEPGARSGQTVVTGHTVHTGGGVMNRLGELRPGDVVQVRDEGRLVDYRATRVQVYSKAELAAAAEELFGQDRGRGRLVLVTCTDFTDGEYLSNIVVLARPVRDAASA